VSNQLKDVGVCVFDAYGTLFDVVAAAASCKDEIGDKWADLADLWRTKQLNYTWLRSLMDEYVGFWQVTEEALDFALETLDISDSSLKKKLMGLYEKLDAYPEVKGMLWDLKEKGIRTAILSNGTERMLWSAVRNAGINEYLEEVISVEKLEIFKPHPAVYQLAVSELAISPERICFMSSNAWDVAGAANFGFQVVWINRFGQKAERLPGEPVAELTDLKGLAALIG